VEVFVVVRGNVAAGELLFDPVEELGIDGHHVFVVAVDGAILNHPNLIVALDNLRLDFADFLVHQIAPVFFAGDDRFARLFDACRTERIGLPWETERRLGLFPRLQQRLIGPLRSDGRIRIPFVEILNAVESDGGCFAQRPVERSQDLRSYTIRHKALASLSKDQAQLLTNLVENRALYSPRAPITVTLPTVTANKSLYLYSLKVEGGGCQWEAANGRKWGLNGRLVQ